MRVSGRLPGQQRRLSLRGISQAPEPNALIFWGFFLCFRLLEQTIVLSPRRTLLGRAVRVSHFHELLGVSAGPGRRPVGPGRRLFEWSSRLFTSFWRRVERGDLQRHLQIRYCSAAEARSASLAHSPCRCHLAQVVHRRGPRELPPR